MTDKQIIPGSAGLSGEDRELLARMLEEEGLELGGAARIPPRPPHVDVPLSFSQRQLWFLDQLQPGHPAYNLPTAFRLKGRLDVRALERTLDEIERRHEALRTTFALTHGQPVQVVGPPHASRVPFIDLGQMPTSEREAEALRLATEDARRPFDLSAGPLWRARLLRLSDEEHVAVMTMHHIVSDASSVGVLVREVCTLYDAFTRGEPSPLAEPPIQYADYAVWQRAELQGEAFERHLDYWREQLRDLPTLELPLDRPRPPSPVFRGAKQTVTLPRAVAEGLRRVGQEEGATLFMVLLAALAALLSRHARQREVVVGTPVAGRRREELESLIGYFVNALVLRVDLGGDPTFRELVARAREVCLGAYAHQDVPFERLVEELAPERSLDRTPLFQVALALQNVPRTELRLPGLSLEALSVEAGAAKFDLTFVVEETAQGLTVTLEYNADVFESETAGRMLGHFRTLLRAVAAQPDEPAAALPLLNESERAALLAEWRGAGADYRRPACLHRLFEEQAARTPEAVALTFEGEHLTYAELNHRANRVAHMLRSFSVGPEVPVALCLERSADLVVAIVGVLKAGGAYLPLDPSYPAERLRFMLEDARPPVLLTEERRSRLLPDFDGRVVALDAQRELVAGFGDEDPEGAGALPDNTAYIIYTSGSTGRAKGTLVTHSNVTRLFAATDAWFGFSERDVWTLFHSYAFDFSVWELWGALLHGGRVVVVPYLVSRSPESFLRLLGEEGVTVLNQTPSAFRQLMQAEEAHGSPPPLALRFVVFGGEALDPASLRPWVARRGVERPRLVNMYGITETTVHVTYRPLTARDVEGGKGSPVGGPIPDLQLYVLDGRLEPAPVGVPGELYVGGAGLARGYLNRPALTAERFVPDPFAAERGARLYRTGDLVRRLPGGELEYLGRIDQQVKVRGFRIEPGEIEAALATHPAVREAVVVALDDEQGGKRLAAYVTLRRAATGDELRAHVAARLPDYMVPSAFVVLERLPLTPNGKVDRRALPAPGHERPALDGGYVAPRTETEDLLAVIWADVLGLERVGVHDNFFALGGDSLRSVRLLALARERGLDFSLQQLFRHQTIAELARDIVVTDPAAAARPPYVPFEAVSAEDRAKMPEDVVDAYPPTMAQSGMLFHMALTPGAPVYHNVNSCRLRAPFDAECFDEAVQRAVARHAVLRTSFDLTSFGEPLQLVHREARMEVNVFDLRHLGEEEQAAALDAYVEQEKTRRFDLQRPPLLRFHLHRRTDDTFQFTFTDCHPILDGWSLNSTLAEIFTTYFALLNGQSPAPEPPPPIAFGEVIRLEREALASPECRRFWDEKLSGLTPTLLPRWPGARRVEVIQRVRQLYVDIPLELSDGLQRVARALKVPVKSVLLAAHLKVLGLLGGRDEVVSGFVVNGRPEALGGEQVRGMFLNTVPLRLRLRGGTWADLVREAFEAEWELLPFRRLPLFAMQQRAGEQAPFEASFNFVHFHVLEGVLASGEVEVVSDDRRRVSEETHFPLAVNFGNNPGGSQLYLMLQYNALEFSAEQVGQFAGYYREALERIARDPDARHGARGLLSREEGRLLALWNDTARDYPRDASLHRLFEAQAAAKPDEVAVVDGQGSWSYGELNARANRLARYLRGRGVGTESLVGICVERSVEMVVGLLGILKAGGAYVPLDAAYPADRLAFMIEDSGLRTLVTQSALAERLPPHGAEVIRLDADRGEIEREAADGPADETRPENLAYVIYTSGSTGRPKGVQVSHRSVVNFLNAMRRQQDWTPREVLLAVTTLSFDIAGLELFLPLTTGARVVLVGREVAADGVRLRGMLEESGATIMQATPSTWRLLFEAGWRGGALKILCGGEALPKALAEQLAAAGQRVWNLYGPTETTIWSTTCELGSPPESVTIGRPIDNTRVYVVGEDLSLAPVGVPGELYVGGDGVARGYLNRPALTAERFVPDPFAAERGGRLYRTGDLVRRLPGGELEYLGRIDQQVKVRGFRIEPGEIEAALEGHESVRQAAVIVAEGEAGAGRLVAYFVARGAGVEVGELRSALEQRLPDYMVPSAFVPLDELPLTPNGKVDRKALAARREDLPASTAYVAPRTPTEEAVASAFAEVLGLGRVGAEDNFFHAGGHSLAAMRVVSRLRAALGIELVLHDLFETPTAAGLAARVAGRPRTAAATPALAGGAHGKTAPLSFAQQRLWFLDRLDPEGAAFNLPAAVRLLGRLDVDALGRAHSEVLRRHEVLRSTYADVDGVGVQIIGEPQERPLPVEDLSGFAPEEREAEARARAEAEAARPFDLVNGPVLRARLLRLSEEEHMLLLTMHHIATDGWSMGVLVREVCTLYDAFTRGQQSPLPELPIQYADFAKWQRESLEGETLERQVGYWRERLADAPAALTLPTDKPRPPRSTQRGSVEKAFYGEELTRGLKELGEREGVTLHMLLLAGWAALLSRYAGQDVVVVGTPVAGRGRAEVEGLVGLFVTMLAVPVRVSGDESFHELVRRVREECLDAYANQDVPFERLVEELQPERDMSRHPLFQVMFALQNAPEGRFKLPGLTAAMEPAESGAVQCDIFLSIVELRQGLKVAANYSTDLFEAATVRKHLAHFETLLERIVAAPGRSLSSLWALEEAEQLRLVSEWNDTRREYPADECIHDLFGEQAARTPDAVALTFEGEHLTYAELNRRANQLAHHLSALGAGPETRVGVGMGRSAETFVALLGTLKAGAAYVPLDPAYPRERLSFMLEDAGVKILLTQSRLSGNLPEHAAAAVVLVDDDWPVIASRPDDNPPRRATADGAAYVIYTSGSTGRPKGVVGLHRGAVNRFRWMWETYPFEEGEVCCQKTSLSFVDSVWETFGPLLAGVRTVVFSDEVVKDAERFVEALAEERVTRLVLVPSLLRAILETGDDLAERLSTLRYCICSGEALTAELAQRFRELLPHCALLNLYGSSEAAADATAYLVPDGETTAARMSIGRPIANMRAYVLDRHMRPVPAGVQGELYVGGEGLARGYIDRPELTAEKFVPDPFSLEPGGRLYRTGDLARFSAGGEIEFLGRVDHQVKVRGFRIELGEVELTLKQCPGVRQCVVVADGGQLHAYVETEPDSAPTDVELRLNAAERLPDYMVPSAFIMLDELPLTPSGKIDRKALAALGRPAASPAEAFVPPRTPLEGLICETFAHVLGLERIGIREHFFHAGGHSLLATRVVSRLRAALGQEVTLRDLFEAPTAEALAVRVERAQGGARASETEPELAAGRRGVSVPLSFAQQRLWFLEQLEPGTAAYNMPLAVRLVGRLDVEALERCLTEITRRHEVLRTTFASADARPVQVIAPHAAVKLPVEDLRHLPGGARAGEVQRRLREEALTGFDLSAGPLWRTKLLRFDEEEHVMLSTMHHIITDGWSMDVLVREVGALYGAYVQGRPSPLEELPVQYADYAAWQREYLRGERLEGQLDYWRRQLAGAPATLELPADRPHPKTPTHRGAEHSFTVPGEVRERLRALEQQEDATPFMVLASALAATISCYSGQPEIVLGTHVAGRQRAELEQLIGFFVNTLVLRLNVGAGASFRELVRRAREVCLGAYANQDVPFDRLVEELRPERSLSHTPFFRVLLVFQNVPQRPAHLPGMRLQLIYADAPPARFDLTLYVSEAGGSLDGTFVYSTDIFDAPTVERMTELLQNLLRASADDPDRQIQALDLHPEEVERQLIYSFNDPLE